MAQRSSVDSPLFKAPNKFVIVGIYQKSFVMKQDYDTRQFRGAYRAHMDSSRMGLRWQIHLSRCVESQVHHRLVDHWR